LGLEEGPTMPLTRARNQSDVILEKFYSEYDHQVQDIGKDNGR
jgi:hypothetical protein